MDQAIQFTTEGQRYILARGECLTVMCASVQTVSVLLLSNLKTHTVGGSLPPRK